MVDNKTVNWNTVLNEILYQVKNSKKAVWITWFEERLNLLEDRGVNIPILKDINKLSIAYYKELEKKYNK